MRISRIYQNLPLQIGISVVLDKHKSHYITHVLRLKIHDPLIIFNGAADHSYGEFSAKIKAIEKHHVIVTIDQYHETQRESSLHIHLAQGISRGERMDFVLQKAVELGVREITPVLTQRCNIKIPKEREENRLQHWRGIIESACEQSGRNYIPILHEPVKLPTWLTQPNEDLKLLLNPYAQQKLSTLTAHPAKIRLLIGPEGGLNDDEIALSLQHGFQGVQLGSRILRTETAALAAITSLQIKWGDY